MRLRCGGIFNDYFITHLQLSLTVIEKLKIGQHLAKLWAKIKCPLCMFQFLPPCRMMPLTKRQ